MAKRINNETWIQVKTKYNLGHSVNSLALEFDIPEATVRARKNREGWTQNLRTHVIDLKGNIEQIANSCEPSQLPFIQDEINEILQLQKAVNSFVKGAVDLNLKNLQAALFEPDAEKRINLTAKMKATMADLAGIGNIKPKLEEDVPINEDNEDSNGIVQFYLPHKNKE